MKILLCTDGSAHSKATIKKFANRNFTPNTKIRIICVYEKPSYITKAAPMGALAEYNTMVDNYSIEAAKSATENAAAILRKKHPVLSISKVEIEGSPKSTIIKEAENFGADLIVIGSHGHGFVKGFLLGSVSQSVALHAKCSVEIVRVK